MAPQVEIQLEDVQTKLGALLLQIMGYERVIAELQAENARLRASGSPEGPTAMASTSTDGLGQPFPRAIPDEIRRARGELDEETG